MNIYDVLFSAIFNMMSIYINIRIIKLFLPAKITKETITIPIYAGVWLFNWAVYFVFNIQNLTTISLFVGLMIATCVIFEGGAGKKLAVVAISMASCIITENIVWEMCNRGLLPVESEAVGCLCSVVLEFLIILTIEKYIHLDRYTRLPTVSYLNVILMAVGSIILSEIISIPESSNDVIMFGLGIICFMNVSTYFMYEKMSETYRQNMKNAAMEKQIEMYAKQFEIIGQARDNLRALRHDMKNHVSLINTYLQNQEYKEACEYAAKLCESVDVAAEYIKTGNIGVDSILNYNLERCEKDIGCKAEITVDVPNQPFMPDFDLNIILGNLLDNSLEALRKAEKKYLSIELKFSKGALYISIYNSYNGKLRKKSQRFLSSKEDADHHGIGLANVERIVKKYDGIMKIKHEGEIFGVDIIIYVGGVQM